MPKAKRTRHYVDEMTPRPKKPQESKRTFPVTTRKITKEST